MFVTFRDRDLRHPMAKGSNRVTDGRNTSWRSSTVPHNDDSPGVQVAHSGWPPDRLAPRLAPLSTSGQNACCSRRDLSFISPVAGRRRTLPDMAKCPETRDCLRAVDRNKPRRLDINSEICSLPAPRPRLERGTYCLGGIPEAHPDVAGRGLTCRFAEVIMAGCGPMRPCTCGRWLPVWLPGIWSATLMFVRSAL